MNETTVWAMFGFGLLVQVGLLVKILDIKGDLKDAIGIADRAMDRNYEWEAKYVQVCVERDALKARHEHSGSEGENDGVQG